MHVTLGALVKGIFVALVDAHKNLLPGTVQSFQSARDERLDGDTDKGSCYVQCCGRHAPTAC